MTIRSQTDVRVQLPSRIHVDNVLELFAREERKMLASVPPTGNEEREKQPDEAQKPSPPKLKIFVGHGHDPQWKDLTDFLNRTAGLEAVFYESSSTAGHQTADVIETKIASAEMAFIVHTGEDEDKAGDMHARRNVVHEAGMCLNQFGSGRAIVLLEQGCAEYSNIKGTDQIRFPKGEIERRFGDVLQAILREFPGLKNEG
jgi:predicted nucleotide-binding protein